MPKVKILVIYTAIDLLIGIGVVWCVLQRIPISRFLLPATVLFVLNGIWLVVMVVRTTPPGHSQDLPQKRGGTKKSIRR
ncbi:MAG TPA: hypothetical protein VJV96_04055 [Candidatus Angelobacter sp.]|nr:hypothetical protein [Candidatus Angelobacter sp.]